MMFMFKTCLFSRNPYRRVLTWALMLGFVPVLFGFDDKRTTGMQVVQVDAKGQEVELKAGFTFVVEGTGGPGTRVSAKFDDATAKALAGKVLRLKLGTARSSPALSAVLRPAISAHDFRYVRPPDSSHAVFACGVSGRYWLWSVAGLHGKVAASRRGSWSGSESPSTEDVCLRC